MYIHTHTYVVIHTVKGCINNCGNFIKRWEYQTTIPVS